MEDVYRKCYSCHMMKAFIDGRGVHRTRDFDNRKPLWCCFSCKSLQKRIARIQDSGRAIRGWYDVRQRVRDSGRAIRGWKRVRKNERARFMERAAGLMKDDLRKAMLDAVRHLRKKREVWVKRRRRNVKRAGEKKPDEKVRRESDCNICRAPFVVYPIVILSGIYLIMRYPSSDTFGPRHTPPGTVLRSVYSNAFRRHVWLKPCYWRGCRQRLGLPFPQDIRNS